MSQYGSKQGRPRSGRQYKDMKIEEAILYLLAKKNGGMTTDQLADEINRNRLVVLNGGKPVSSAYVYRTVMQHPETFCKAEGRIFLMI